MFLRPHFLHTPHLLNYWIYHLFKTCTMLLTKKTKISGIFAPLQLWVPWYQAISSFVLCLFQLTLCTFHRHETAKVAIYALISQLHLHLTPCHLSHMVTPGAILNAHQNWQLKELVPIMLKNVCAYPDKAHQLWAGDCASWHNWLGTWPSQQLILLRDIEGDAIIEVVWRYRCWLLWMWMYVVSTDVADIIGSWSDVQWWCKIIGRIWDGYKEYTCAWRFLIE